MITVSAKTKKRVSRIAPFVIKSLIGLLFISPLIIAVFFSLQIEDELTTPPLHLFTSNPYFKNFLEVFQKVPFFTYLKNSLIVCAGAITVQIIVASLAAYGFVFFNFKFKKVFFALVVSAMSIPGEVVVITNYVTIQNLGLYNTYLGLMITIFVGSTSIFMMRQYYMTLPKDYKEAAELDGCGNLRFLLKIATPLSVPTITSLAMYLFVHVYNAFFWPVLVTGSMDKRTVQVGISFLVSGDVVRYSQILASAIVAILPTVILFIFGQDYIINGMTKGGIKG